MMAWLKSPSGSTTTAVAVAAILALFWFAPWTKPFPALTHPGGDVAKPLATASSAGPASTRVAAIPGPGASSASAPVSPPAADARPSQSEPQQQASLPSPAPAGPIAPAAAAPDFDVVRVEPTGEAVIAGRGEPGSDVALLDGGKVIAHVAVDASGQFALLPPTLSEGSHYLTLQSTGTNKAMITSTRGVAVAVARNGEARPMVAMLSPDKPAQVLSDGSALTSTASAGGTEAPASPVSIQAVEALLGGKFTASGVAKAGSQCRLYLNGSFLADVTTGKDGRWSVRIEKGMRPGKYTVRADELEPLSGKVVHRAEVPFDYPANLAGGQSQQLIGSRTQPPGATPSTGLMADGGPATLSTESAKSSAGQTETGSAQPATETPAVTTIVADLHTAKVIRGDSLWRISRKLLGRGLAYTEIYASNTAQIRDPRLIYPGQILVVPAHTTN